MFELFETGVELDAVNDFFPVAEGLASDADGIENVPNIVLDAFFAAVVVGVSVVLDNVDDDVADSDDVDAVVATVVASVIVVGADDDVVDSAVDDVAAVVAIVVVSVVVVGADDDVVDCAVDDVAAVVAIVVVSVVVGGVDDDVVDSVLDDVGTDVVVVDASAVLGGEGDDVVAVVGTVVVNDVVGGVVSAVEVGRVVVTVDDIVELFRFPIVQPSVNLQHEQEVSPVFRLFNRESIIFSNHVEHASSLPIWPVKHNLTSDSSHDWL